MKLYDNGVYLVNGTEIVENVQGASERIKQITGREVALDVAKKGTIASHILNAHNVSGNQEHLQIKFDKLTSHDITYVGIIQTARASGLERFPIPYVLTNCHNSLCAVGGTINEDDHMFGLTAAKKYGGIYVPPHQAVIHQFAREMLASCGQMILGSDSHTRYGALGTMAMGEGGPELVKQLLQRTYDIDAPDVIAVYLSGKPEKGVGPQDIALAIIGEVFDRGYVKNKVMEFVGPGVANLSVDFRIGVDVMTTETTCLSSIWRTDDKVKDFYEIHNRPQDYMELNPEAIAYYDGCIEIDLSEIKPMIAMPFHPSNAFTIEELNALTTIETGNIYRVINENKNYIYNGTSWEEYSDNIDINLLELKSHKYILTITETTEAGAEITLPCYYKVGQDVLDVYLEDERLIKSSDEAGTDGHYVEVGEADSISNKIKITSDWAVSAGMIFEFAVKGEYSI